MHRRRMALVVRIREKRRRPEAVGGESVQDGGRHPAPVPGPAAQVQPSWRRCCESTACGTRSSILHAWTSSARPA